MKILVSIKQQERVDGMITFEVGNSCFPVRVVEKGPTEDEDDYRQRLEVSNEDGQSFVQSKEESVPSEDESVMGQDWKRCQVEDRIRKWKH
ncbi:hypothetical protein GOBAR_DD15072 [Gossypium barbadense]|nr:hypothetical protein GOBAR_DD15072 [Gossypium barbadense]